MENQNRTLVRIGLLVLLLVALSALMAVIFGDRPAEASNTRTVQQMQQYSNALELIYLDQGQYPGPEMFACLGDYPDDQCWHEEGTGIAEDTQLNAVLIKYIPLLSSGHMVESKVSKKHSREGYIYRQLNGGAGYEIQYFLSGSDKNCGFGDQITSDIEEATHHGNTWCHIIR